MYNCQNKYCKSFKPARNYIMLIQQLLQLNASSTTPNAYAKTTSLFHVLPIKSTHSATSTTTTRTTTTTTGNTYI